MATETPIYKTGCTNRTLQPRCSNGKIIFLKFKILWIRLVLNPESLRFCFFILSWDSLQIPYQPECRPLFFLVLTKVSENSQITRLIRAFDNKANRTIVSPNCQVMQIMHHHLTTEARVCVAFCNRGTAKDHLLLYCQVMLYSITLPIEDRPIH